LRTLFGDRCIQFLFETNPGVSTEGIENTLSLKTARPERFELPTLWFEARSDAHLKFVEFHEFYLLFTEALAAGLLVLVETRGFLRHSQLRNQPQQPGGRGGR
jgi:hypothetical protein